LQIVYAHGNGSLKSNFYDAFVSITRGLFNTRDRVAHTRKRKIISHIFSQKNVLEFEPNVNNYVQQFLRQWDRLCAEGIKNPRGNDGEGGWRSRDGRIWLDCLPCEFTLIPESILHLLEFVGFNYLAFDIIGEASSLQ